MILWNKKHSNIPNGRLNHSVPIIVWLYSLLILILKNYSKSGVKLPIIRPVNETHFPKMFFSGNTIAGCEKVNGIDFF